MKELHKFLSRSLRWLSFEAIAYQLLLVGHQLLLFRVAGYGSYGLIGAVFSLVYLTVTVADCGLEPSISPFFSALKKSRHAFRRFILVNLMPNIAVVAALTISAFALKFLLTSSIFHVIDTISTPILCILAALVLTETVKKSLRTILHLAFLNRAAAFIEVGTIVSYIGFVWILYGSGFAIGLPLVFAPMLVTSAVSMLLMVFFLWRFSATLPEKSAPLLLTKRVVKARFFNSLNQLSHTLFSSNFLVPFFAMQFGLAHAGVFKLVSHIAYAVTSILRKTFGLTSDAMLAKTKTMSLSVKREVFWTPDSTAASRSVRNYYFFCYQPRQNTNRLASRKR